MSQDSPNSINWNDFEFPFSERFESARNQAHQAAQLLGSIARAINPEKPEDTHAAMIWQEAHQLLSTQMLKHHKYKYAVLNIATLSLGFQDNSDHELLSISLAGYTNKELKQRLEEILEIKQFNLQHPYELPTFTFGNNQPYDDSDKDYLALCEQVFSNAYHALLPFTQSIPEASEIHIWPHHFDIATLLTYSANKSDKFIGIGLSPGDASVPEPYFYINTWPYPKVNQQSLSPLSAGAWQFDGWTGAILKASEIVQSPDQGKTVHLFLNEAFQRIKLLMFP